MTNLFPNPQKKHSNAALIGMLLMGLFFVALVTVGITIAAHAFGDGSAYSTGYELGRMIKGSFAHSSFKNGLGIGTIIAMLASWDRNRSIRWAVLHAILGWGYVVYFAITRKSKSQR